MKIHQEAALGRSLFRIVWQCTELIANEWAVQIALSPLNVIFFRAVNELLGWCQKRFSLLGSNYWSLSRILNFLQLLPPEREASSSAVNLVHLTTQTDLVHLTTQTEVLHFLYHHTLAQTGMLGSFVSHFCFTQRCVCVRAGVCRQVDGHTPQARLKRILSSRR